MRSQTHERIFDELQQHNSWTETGIVFKDAKNIESKKDSQIGLKFEILKGGKKNWKGERLIRFKEV